ncbi:hypothetical protein GCM10011578_044030 [Streptomyces fuscichromogenes]|uniref:Uncharacterized protein n=1 Tax=Streptomyces fuscichromogenes TaxID=1324013 RepID=A0A917XEE4_9ACTN|nr:hypothetical protein GCM10011578_044030 [Streptomyces fuscichromogenes]
MREDELRQLEEQLHQVLIASGFEWLTDAVQDSAAAGVPQERLLKRRRQSRQPESVSDGIGSEEPEYTTVSDYTQRQYRAGQRTGSVVISTRPMETRERVELLLDALHRMFVELPEVEESTLSFLGEGDDRRPPVFSVTFVPVDTDRRRLTQETVLSRERAELHRRGISQVIDRLREGIRE